MLVENDPNHNQTTPTPPVLSFVSPFLILTTHSTTSPHTSLSDPYHPPTPHTHTHTHRCTPPPGRPTRSSTARRCTATSTTASPAWRPSPPVRLRFLQQ